MTDPHTHKRRQNVILAIVLGAVALVMLLVSLPMWKSVLGTVG